MLGTLIEKFLSPEINLSPKPVLNSDGSIRLPGLDNHGMGTEAFLKREVLPYAPDAWYEPDKVKIGYEINFNRYFYKPQPLRSLEEIRADLIAVEKEAEGVLDEILGKGE